MLNIKACPVITINYYSILSCIQNGKLFLSAIETYIVCVYVIQFSLSSFIKNKVVNNAEKILSTEFMVEYSYLINFNT